MVELKIKLYKLDELSAFAQGHAIEEHRQFLLDTLRPDYIDGFCDWNNPEKMEMYHSEYEYIEDNDEPVIESIEANDYLFYYDGTICQTVTYTAGTEAGQTWATIHGERYRAETGV